MDMTIDSLMKEAHECAVEHGWWENERNFGEQIALMHSELSEALEEYRKYGLDGAPTEHCRFGWLLYQGTESEHGEKPWPFFHDDGVGMKPEGIAAEMADLLIRAFDTCARYKIPLAEALRVKMAYNRTRPYRHGNKLA